MRAAMIVLLLHAGAVHAVNVRPLLDAIRQVETGGRSDPAQARGDDGRSLGPYQIQRPYWRDSGVPGNYEQVRDTAYAERVVVAYWKRYCPRALAAGDWETLARVHNGGPLGKSKASTKVYWLRVRRALRGR